MLASMRAQPPLYCLQLEDDSVPIAVQGASDRSLKMLRSLDSGIGVDD